MANLRSLDLNLLTVFEAVYDTHNITEAAKRLGLTQSAASHALGRLREALRDDLFVRSSEGLKPTEAALSLYPAVRSALDGIRTAVAGKATFDPASARGTFRVAIPYVIGPFVGLRLEARLKAEAPSVELYFDTRTIPLNLLSELEEGRTDVAVDWWTATEARFVNQRIFDDRLMIVVGRDHPRIREAPSLAALERENFVGLHRRPGQWDRALAIKQVLALEGLEDCLQRQRVHRSPADRRGDRLRQRDASVDGRPVGEDGSGAFAAIPGAPAAPGNQDDLACRASARSRAHVAAKDGSTGSTAICR